MVWPGAQYKDPRLEGRQFYVKRGVRSSSNSLYFQRFGDELFSAMTSVKNTCYHKSFLDIDAIDA